MSETFSTTFVNSQFIWIINGDLFDIVFFAIELFGIVF